MRRLLAIGAGAGAGLFVWAYDYDFFLNAGGPETPISRAILRVSHLQDATFPVALLWPLFVLIGLGAFAGGAASLMVARFSGSRGRR